MSKYINAATDRISIIPETNDNKNEKLNIYLNNLCKEKNEYSKFFHNNYLQLLWKNEKLTSLNKNVNNIFMTGWECQKFFNESLILNYKEQLERVFYIKKLSIKTITYTYTDKNNETQIIDIKDIIKLNKIIDDKVNCTLLLPSNKRAVPNFVYKNSPKESKLANLINDIIYLEYYSYRLNYTENMIVYDNHYIRNMLSEHKEPDTKFFQDYFIKLDKTTELFYSYNEKIQEKINRLVNIKISNLLNSCKINYKNGNIIKAPQSVFGKQPRIFIDKTNSKYKYWYCLDIINESITKEGKIIHEKELLFFPLAYNNKYHKHFLEYNNKISKSTKKQDNLLKI